MPTTSDYLTQLEQDRQDLVDNLETQGITGLTGDETFTELVPEVLNISGGGGLDWSAIGYSGEPSIIQDGYNYAKDIYDNWDSTNTNISGKYRNNRQLIFMPLVDTSNATNMSDMFSKAVELIYVPLLNTSNVTNMESMFDSCPIQSIPLFDTSKVTKMRNMFNACYCLKTVPLLDTSSINTNNGFQGTFSTCYSLTDTSLDNILQMCINATSYSGTKTLQYLGFYSYNGFPASRIQALPHYQDFINAGWTIGY